MKLRRVFLAIYATYLIVASIAAQCTFDKTEKVDQRINKLVGKRSEEIRNFMIMYCSFIVVDSSLYPFIYNFFFLISRPKSTPGGSVISTKKDFQRDITA